MWPRPEYGWYGTALTLEEAMVESSQMMLGAADVFKCFDQLIRGIIYQLAALAVMPRRILDTCRRFHEGM